MEILLKYLMQTFRIKEEKIDYEGKDSEENSWK